MIMYANSNGRKCTVFIYIDPKTGVFNYDYIKKVRREAENAQGDLFDWAEETGPQDEAGPASPEEET